MSGGSIGILTGSDALRAYQQTRNQSSATASLFRAEGTASESARLASGPGGQAARASTSASAAVAGGSFAAIDADLASRSRYIDDVYLSEESQARLASEAEDQNAADAGVFERALDASLNAAADDPANSVAADAANVIADIVAYAKNGLTEVDSTTARDELGEQVLNNMVDALGESLQAAGLSEDDAEAVAGYLTDRIIDQTRAGDAVINLSLEQAATLTTAQGGVQSGAGGLSGFESLQHIGGSIKLDISVNTQTGETRVVQSTAAVQQSVERAFAAGAALAGPAPAGQPLGADNGGGVQIGSDLADKLKSLVDDPEALEQAAAAQALVDTLSAILERQEEAEDADEIQPGQRDNQDDAEGEEADGTDARFSLDVPLPSLAAGRDAEGGLSLLYLRETEQTVASLSFSPVDQGV